MSGYKHSISKVVRSGESLYDAKFEFYGLTPEQLEKILSFEKELLEGED